MKIKNQEMLLRYIRENKIEVVALDLDRTTLRSDSSLAPRTKRAIQSAIDAGMEVVVISGRPRCSLPESVLAIPGIRYLVTSNGAAVNKRERENGGDFQEERIWAWTLTEESALSILENTVPYFEREQLAYETFVEGTAYASEDYVNQPTKYGAPERAISYVQNTRIAVPDFPAFIRAHAHELDSFDMIVRERDIFYQLKSLLAEKVDDIYMTSSMERMIEISSKDAGKASGLRFVLEELGLDPCHVVAFGDGDNDADMLRYAGLGIAMANAMPYSLECADYVGKSNDEDGVAEIIELIIQERG